MLESSGISIGDAWSIATRSEGAVVLIPLISDDSTMKNQSLALRSESTGVLMCGKMGKGCEGMWTVSLQHLPHQPYQIFRGYH